MDPRENYTMQKQFKEKVISVVRVCLFFLMALMVMYYPPKTEQFDLTIIWAFVYLQFESGNGFMITVTWLMRKNAPTNYQQLQSTGNDDQPRPSRPIRCIHPIFQCVMRYEHYFHMASFVAMIGIAIFGFVAAVAIHGDGQYSGEVTIASLVLFLVGLIRLLDTLYGKTFGLDTVKQTGQLTTNDLLERGDVNGV